MTVSTTDSRAAYTCNGATVAFSFPYLFLADADLVVLLVDTLTTPNTETTLALTTDYTVTGAGNPAGGTVTTTGVYSANYKLVIYRDPALTQGLDLVANDPLPAEDLEQALDRRTLVSQRLADLQSRSVRLSDGDTSGANPVLPTPAPLEHVRWNAAGTAMESVKLANTGTLAVTPFAETLLDDANADAAKVTLRLQVEGLAALRALTGQLAGERVYLTYHTTEGDGGAGVFRWVSGAAPGTYTDNNGTIILPTGGEGSSCWLRQYNGPVLTEWFGAVWDGVTDDSLAIQAAFDIGEKVVFPGYGKVCVSSNTLFYNHDYVQIDGRGSKIIFSDNTKDGLVCGTGVGSGSDPGGVVQNIYLTSATTSAPTAGTGSAGFKLNGLRHVDVEQLHSEYFDIGYDLINNCFGSQFTDCRALFDRNNVGFNLREGPQSGNDLLFDNCWFYGAIAGVHISPDGGGFQFNGGQIGANFTNVSAFDTNGAVVYGKDYLTGVTGSLSGLVFNSVDFERPWKTWAIRGYGETSLTLDSNRFLGSGSLGILKGDSVVHSRITLVNSYIQNDFLDSIVLAGKGSEFELEEIGTRAHSTGTIGGLAQSEWKTLANYASEATKTLDSNNYSRAKNARISAVSDPFVVYASTISTTILDESSQFLFIVRDQTSGGMAVGVRDMSTGVTVISSSIVGVTFSNAGSVFSAQVTSGTAPRALFFMFLQVL